MVRLCVDAFGSARRGKGEVLDGPKLAPAMEDMELPPDVALSPATSLRKGDHELMPNMFVGEVHPPEGEPRRRIHSPLAPVRRTSGGHGPDALAKGVLCPQPSRRRRIIFLQPFAIIGCRGGVPRAPAGLPALEIEAQSELNDPRVHRCTGDNAKLGPLQHWLDTRVACRYPRIWQRRQIRSVRTIELRMIEGVEEVGAKFNIRLFVWPANGESLPREMQFGLGPGLLCSREPIFP